MVLRSIDHRMQLFPMDTNQQCYVCNVSPKSSYLDIFHRIDNNRPDSAQSASGKHIYNKKNWPLSLLLYGYFGELYTTKYPGKPSEGKKNECTNKCLLQTTLASVTPPIQIRRQSAFCKVLPSPVDWAPGRWSGSNRRRIWQRASTQPLVNSLKPRQNVKSNVLLGSLRFWQCSENAFNSSWISFDRSLKNLIWKQSRLKKIWHGTVTKVFLYSRK